jgi:hypothetical protein
LERTLCPTDVAEVTRRLLALRNARFIEAGKALLLAGNATAKMLAYVLLGAAVVISVLCESQSSTSS